MIIETSIVLPISIIVLLIMITFTFMLYEVYARDVASRVFVQSHSDLLVEGTQDVFQSKMEKYLQSKSLVKSGKENIVFEEKFVRVKHEFKVPFFRRFRSEDSEIDITNSGSLSKVFSVEVGEDFFDSFSFSSDLLEKYDVLLDTIFNTLENY